MMLRLAILLGDLDLDDDLRRDRGPVRVVLRDELGGHLPGAANIAPPSGRGMPWYIEAHQ